MDDKQNYVDSLMAALKEPGEELERRKFTAVILDDTKTQLATGVAFIPDEGTLGVFWRQSDLAPEADLARARTLRTFEGGSFTIRDLAPTSEAQPLRYVFQIVK